MVKNRDKHIPGATGALVPAGSFADRFLAWMKQDDGCVYWLKTTLLILILLALIYPGAVFRGEIFQSSDAGNSLMFSQVGDKALAQGEYPLWNPYLFAGMPSFGSSAYVRYLYPPSILFNFLQNTLGFPPLTWMLGHLLFGGLGMAWLLRRWHFNQAEVLLGVAVWLLFPKVVAWGVHGHGSKLGAAMYLPWLVGWALKILDGKGLRAMATMGLLLGVQLLRGHPQISYYTLGCIGWLALGSVVWPMESAWREIKITQRLLRVGQLGISLALGFLIAGILLIPAQDYARISIRGQDVAGGGGVGLDYATGWSLAPQEMATFVLPSAAGFGQATYMGRMPFTDYPNYLGFLTLFLAGMAWRVGWRRWLVVLGLLTVLVVMVSWGNFGFGLYELLYNWLPFFNKFRVPSMILVLMAFSAALVVPHGARALRQGEVPGPRWLPVALCGVTGVVLLLAGGLSLAQNGYFTQLKHLAALGQKPTAQVLLNAAWNLQKGDLIRIGFLLLLAAGALQWARAHIGFRSWGLGWLLVVLVVVDLSRVDARITNPDQYLLRVARDNSGQASLQPALPLLHHLQPTRVAGGPQAKLLGELVGHDRVFPLGYEGGQNTWMADGIRSLGGYHPAKLAAYEIIRKRLYGPEPAGRVADWLGARVVSFERSFSSDELALLGSLGLNLDPQPLTTSAPYLYRNRSYLPRARLVGHWVLATDSPGQSNLADFLTAIQNGTVDPNKTVRISGAEGVGAARGAFPEPGALPPAVFVDDGLNEVTLKASPAVPAMLILADMAAPGWRVFVDGERRPLLTADFVLRAVELAPGNHDVRFVYHDPSVRRGLTLTGIGLVLTLGLLLVGIWKSNRDADPGERLDA